MCEQETAVRSWKPTPFIWLSILVHLVAVIATVLQPEYWRWAVGVIVTNHFLVCLAVFLPRNGLLGENLTRLPPAAIRRGEVCLTFDDGPDPKVTPRVLDTLDRYGAKASFFCVGKQAAVFPDLVREIARRGHSVENHSYHHSNAFAFYGWTRLRREISRAQDVLANNAGKVPSLFRAPIGFRSPFLDPALAAYGLSYVSWTRRGFDGVSTDARRILERLTAGLAAGDILLLHDRNVPPDNPTVLHVLPQLLEQIAARGLQAVSLPEALRE